MVYEYIVFELKKEEMAFNTQYHVSEHFFTRMNQRGITEEMVELALRYGQKIWGKDSLYYFMGKRQAKRFGRMAEKLEGVVIVIHSKTRKMVTVFRNRQWPKKIHHKK